MKRRPKFDENEISQDIDEITNYLKGYGFKIVADNIVSADSLEADFLFQKI